MKQNGQFDPDSPPPKATLFCPECDHAGPITTACPCAGSGPHRAYCCPECDATLTTRPTTPPAQADRDVSRPICPSD